jgi:hypothetical protein
MAQPDHSIWVEKPKYGKLKSPMIKTNWYVSAGSHWQLYRIRPINKKPITGCILSFMVCKY